MTRVDACACLIATAATTAADITTLEDERKQLNVKIEKMKKANAGDHEFETLLKATNRLRLQQDEEVRLAENMRRQRHALQVAEQRKMEGTKRLTSLRNSASASSSAHALLEQLENEVRPYVLQSVGGGRLNRCGGGISWCGWRTNATTAGSGVLLLPQRRRRRRLEGRWRRKNTKDWRSRGELFFDQGGSRATTANDGARSPQQGGREGTRSARRASAVAHARRTAVSRGRGKAPGPARRSPPARAPSARGEEGYSSGWRRKRDLDDPNRRAKRDDRRLEGTADKGRERALDDHADAAGPVYLSIC